MYETNDLKYEDIKSQSPYSNEVSFNSLVFFIKSLPRNENFTTGDHQLVVSYYNNNLEREKKEILSKFSSLYFLYFIPILVPPHR